MEVQEQKVASGSKKKWLIGGGVAALVLAGGVGAGALFMKSPKAAYLAAESETASEMVAFFEDKYKEELKWSELAKTAVIQNDLKITGEIQSDYEESPIFDIINSSAINISATSDVKNKKFAFGLGGEIADVKVDNFELFATQEEYVFNAPFLTEAISVSAEKLNELADGELSCGQDVLFETEIMTKEQQEYIKKNLATTIFKELPEEAFTKEKNKIVMDLSKQDVKKVMEAIAKKLETDPELETILKQVMATQGVCDDETVTEMKKQLIDGLGEIEFGFVSTIWVEKGKIIERELKFKETDDFVITGKQTFGNEFTFDYQLKGAEEQVSIDGKFQKSDKASDRVQLALEDVKIVYESEENKEKNQHNFERKFIFEGAGESVTLNWDGTSEYRADSVNGEHTIYIEMAGLGKIAITIEQDSKKVKAIELPAKIKDVSNLSEEELSDYMATVLENALVWAENFMEETGFNDYFYDDYYYDDYYYDEDFDFDEYYGEDYDFEFDEDYEENQDDY
ncbi:hypothetical protein MHH70_16810 [Metasolibacillus sp. FSL H7-0170]|uniref:hypothetical protein n=1 Tax=Metasolibacillus TaxID=2703677 RepID=UPI000D366C87|nr:hypothetical protein [Metasolibacillus fluoroglycofenilyticus]